MKLKRYIAFALCALYIAATAAVSLASVTCECLDLKRQAVGHLCDACCCGETDFAGDECLNCWFGMDCDCTRHSTEIDLYTSSHSDDSERYVRCAVSELPPSLVAEAPAPVVSAHGAGYGFTPPYPLVRPVVLRADGWRAPPFGA